MKARSLIYLGIYALLGIFIAKKLVFQYQFGEDGINLLPINIFEFVLFALALLVVIITIFTFFRLAKKVKTTISGKVKSHIFISLIIASIILFLLLQNGYNQWIVPVALIIYGIIILNLNRLINSKFLFLAIAEIVLGITVLFVENNIWLFLSLGFGVFPILFGIIQLNKRKTIF